MPSCVRVPSMNQDRTCTYDDIAIYLAISTPCKQKYPVTKETHASPGQAIWSEPPNSVYVKYRTRDQPKQTPQAIGYLLYSMFCCCTCSGVWLDAWIQYRAPAKPNTVSPARLWVAWQFKGFRCWCSAVCLGVPEKIDADAREILLIFFLRGGWKCGGERASEMTQPEVAYVRTYLRGYVHKVWHWHEA